MVLKMLTGLRKQNSGIAYTEKVAFKNVAFKPQRVSDWDSSYHVSIQLLPKYAAYLDSSHLTEMHWQNLEMMCIFDTVHKFDSFYIHLLFYFLPVPEKPRLMVSPTNMGTALLQWHPPPNTHGPLQGYRLRFGRKDVEPLTVIEFPERENHYTTKEIHKGASYVFRLSARNKVGFGEETVKEITTPEDTPSGFPQGIVAKSATTSTIQVTWQPVLLAERNGIIIKYALQYKDINSPRSPSELFITAPESTVNLDGLRADTTYDIKMCAFTSKGSGPYSPSIQFRTQPLDQGRRT